jgi:hypothetical protein
MTLADRIREEGLQKGLEKGRLEGEMHSRRRALLDVLEARFGTLPARLVEALSTVSDVARLEKLLKSAAVCADLGVFASNS